jgi:hypothetical protein
MSNTPNIVGTDGNIPIYDPNRKFMVWNINEIYLGNIAKDKYVPKVDDLVVSVNVNSYVMYRVSYVNELNLVPTLQEMVLEKGVADFTKNDILLGIGPVTHTDTYRVYLDTTVMPYVMAVDSRLVIPGSMTKYAKIFLGTDTNDAPTVISRVYDSTGKVLSDSIVLETVEGSNSALKRVPVFNSNSQLLDGELVTIVFYDDLGRVVSKRQLMVENTGFTPKPDEATKYITSIALESAFMSLTNDTVIEYPVNATVSSMSLYGVVTYSDGTTLRLPVDGTKFKIFGLEQYIASNPGHTRDLILSYTMSKDEKSYGTVSYDNNVITKPYTMVTVAPNLAYSVKIMCYPRYIDEANGFKLYFYLFNLDRNIFKDVTDLVTFNESNGTFDPKAYGVLQRKSIKLNLRDVSEGFKHFNQVQLIDVVLIRPPELDLSTFTVSHESSGEDTYLNITTAPDPTATNGGFNISRSTGTGIQAVIQRPGDTVVDLSCHQTTLEDWLKLVYYNTYPLINRYMEVRPPMPSHFIVDYKDKKLEFPIYRWNELLSLENSAVDKQSLLVTFIKRTPTNDLYLSCNVFHLVG